MRKKNKYLVGWDHDACVVYGAEEKGIRRSQVQWANPMTLTQAKRELKKLRGGKSCNRAIYELTRIEEKAHIER